MLAVRAAAATDVRGWGNVEHRSAVPAFDRNWLVDILIGFGDMLIVVAITEQITSALDESLSSSLSSTSADDGAGAPWTTTIET